MSCSVPLQAQTFATRISCSTTTATMRLDGEGRVAAFEKALWPREPARDDEAIEAAKRTLRHLVLTDPFDEVRLSFPFGFEGLLN